jgi:hypothetical protein
MSILTPENPELTGLVGFYGYTIPAFKNSKFDLGYPAIPNCGRNGCFAGLIALVACDMPELFNIHRKARWTDKFNEHEPTGLCVL